MFLESIFSSPLNFHIVQNNLLLFILLGLLIPAFYDGTSTISLLKSWFWYFEEEDAAISNNIQFLSKLKKNDSYFLLLIINNYTNVNIW